MMHHVRTLTLMIGLALASSAAMAADTPTPAPPPTKATVGQKAPSFTLQDTSGKTHTLGDFEGRIVVLEWFNAECPYSGRASNMAIHSTGKAKALRQNLRKVDPSIVYLLVDSTARNKTPKKMTEIARAAAGKYGIDAPILIDHEGVVGHAYEAQKTPHMFVIDAEGVLRYQGAFDDDKSNRNTDATRTTNYVLQAVTQLKAAEEVKPTKTRPWGCGVKYAAAH